MRLSNIFLLLFMVSLTGILLYTGYDLGIKEGGGYLWVGCGLFFYVIILSLDLKNNPNKDMGSDANAGQAFILCAILGPVIAFMFMDVIISALSKPKKKED